VPNRRPKLEIVAPSASPEEAAAVVAALEQFLRDYAPVVVAEPEKRNPWQRAGLLESTSRLEHGWVGAGAWGDPVPWGA
jgi:hypothetical protein